MRRSVSDPEHRKGHEGHACDDARDGHVMVAEALGSGEELVEGYVNHDAGYGCKAYCVDGRRPERQQYGHADDCSGRFGHAREKRVFDGFAAASCRVIYRHGYGYPLGDVVYGNRDNHREGHIESVKCRDEAGHAFRKVVYAYGESQHGGCAAQMVVAGSRELVHGVHLVRIFVLRDESVNECDECHSSEESCKRDNLRCACVTVGRKRGDRLGQQLHKGDVDHDSGRETERSGEYACVCFSRRYGYKRSDARRGSGHECQQEGVDYCLDVIHMFINEKYREQVCAAVG